MREMEVLVEAFKALSNPHRLKIYLAIIDCCRPESSCEIDHEGMSKCVGDLGKSVSIAPSTLSHHLKELSHAGLIKMERRGKNIFCGVEEGRLTELKDFFCNAAID